VKCSKQLVGADVASPPVPGVGEGRESSPKPELAALAKLGMHVPKAGLQLMSQAEALKSQKPDLLLSFSV
jgi:hypothetical protein